MKTYLLSLGILLILGISCEPEDSAETKPLPPKLIGADSLISYSVNTGFSFEKGTGPAEEGDGITIRWELYTEINATHFILYRTADYEPSGLKPYNFKEIARFPVLSSEVQNQYRDTVSFEKDKLYFYQMTALSGKTESAPSNQVFYSVSEKPIITSPVNGETNVSLTPQLEWKLANGADFIILVRKRDNRELMWAYITFPPSGYSTQNQSLIYGADSLTNPTYHEGTITKSDLQPNTVYEWKVISTKLTSGYDRNLQFYTIFAGIPTIPSGAMTSWHSFRTKN